MELTGAKMGDMGRNVASVQSFQTPAVTRQGANPNPSLS